MENVVLTGYIAAINIIGFVLMGMDKNRAKRHAWRIPEKTLFGCALLGGSVGIFAGMYTFRHKTRHASFKIGVPVILIVQLAVWNFIGKMI